MKQTIKISVPDSWKDITLKQYLALQSDLENYKDDEEAQTAFMLYHLCGIGLVELKSLPKETYEGLLNELNKFIGKTDMPLQRIITIDGIEYGIEPNLSQMAYGTFIDITKYDTFTIDKNWAKIMSILYRPIEKRLGDTYSIQPYDGNIDETKFLDVTMDIHFGSLFFFVRMYLHLLSSTLNSTMQTVVELLPNTKLISGISGKVIQQLLNSQMETLGQSIPLSKSR